MAPAPQITAADLGLQAPAAPAAAARGDDARAGGEDLHPESARAAQRRRAQGRRAARHEPQRALPAAAAVRAVDVADATFATPWRAARAQPRAGADAARARRRPAGGRRSRCDLPVDADRTPSEVRWTLVVDRARRVDRRGVGGAAAGDALAQPRSPTCSARCAKATTRSAASARASGSSMAMVMREVNDLGIDAAAPAHRGGRVDRAPHARDGGDRRRRLRVRSRTSELLLVNKAAEQLLGKSERGARRAAGVGARLRRVSCSGEPRRLIDRIVRRPARPLRSAARACSTATAGRTTSSSWPT